MLIRYAAVSVLILLAFLTGVAFSQGALDPVKAAPHIYQLEFENERVRVLRRTLRQRENAPLVSQPDRVVVYLNACAWVEDDGQGGKRMQSFKFGSPTWAPAGSHGGETPNVIQPCEIIEVELKEPRP